MSHFNQSKLEIKNCLWTTKFKRLLEMCFVQYEEMKSAYISTNNSSSFYDCKKCKTCCHDSDIPFEDQKLTIMLFGGDGTRCLARKTSCDFEKRYPSPILKRVLSQSQPSTTEPVSKRQNHSLQGIIMWKFHWLIQLTKNSFTFSPHTLSVYSRAT